MIFNKKAEERMKENILNGLNGRVSWGRIFNLDNYSY